MLRVNFSDMRRMLDAHFKADMPIHMIGSPGIGKTAVIHQIGKMLGVEVVSLILSQCDPSDLGGVPCPVTDASGKTTHIARLPIGPIRRACEVGCILFIDEYSQASAPLQGASLTLINERRAGDFILHPNTRIVLASNPEDESASGQPITPPALNRATQVEVAPSLEEIVAYMANIGEEGSPERLLATDYAYTMEGSVNLVQINPPPGIATSGQPWASPRAIERAIRVCAAIQDVWTHKVDPIVAATLEGNLGPEVAGALVAIWKNRGKLPTMSEILKDPAAAKVPPPSDVDAGVASLGLIGQVASVNPSAAWIYVARTEGEIRIAGAKIVSRHPIKSTNEFKTEGERARTKLLASVGKMLNSATF